MKRLLLAFIGLMFIASGFAQNNSVKIVSKKDGSILNGTEHIIKGWWAAFEVKEEFLAVMESRDSVLVAIKRQELSTISGSYDFFCWYLCYAPVAAGSKPVWAAEDSLMMHRDDTAKGFAVYLQPQTKDGIAKYRYVFYPEDDPTDSSYFDVTFDIGYVGIEENQELNITSFPNPFSSELIVTVPDELSDDGLTYQIVDVAGRLVLMGRLTTGTNTIYTSNNMESGMYMMNILQNDAVILNKQILKD